MKILIGLCTRPRIYVHYICICRPTRQIKVIMFLNVLTYFDVNTNELDSVRRTAEIEQRVNSKKFPRIWISKNSVLGAYF